MKGTETIAGVLNRGCHCITLDVDRLEKALDARVRGLFERMRADVEGSFSPGPVFIEAADVEAIADVVRAIEHVVTLGPYRASAFARAPETARVETSARGVFYGYDFHLADDGPKLIEVNTNAGGAMLNVALGRAHEACCPEVEPLMRHAHGGVDLERAFLDMFRAEAAACGRERLERIAIVDDDPERQFLHPEFLLFRSVFHDAGIDARIVDPSALELRDGRLLHDGDPIDLVYARSTDFYLTAPTSRAVRGAWESGAAVVTPHPRGYALYADKRNLVALSDPERLRAWGARDRAVEVLTASVPRTRAVADAEADALWAERKRLFFKPATGYGSRAAYAGAKLTKSVFARILEGGDYLAQDVVPPSDRRVRVDGKETSMKVDVRAYVYDGTIQMLAARLYRGQTTNFRTPGGGFAPLYRV